MVVFPPKLQRPEIVSEIAQVLLDSGLPPECLVLEITESVTMQDMKLSNERLTQPKQLGVKVAVDDFGTGYSSLKHIRRFPVDILKVDKSFVDGVNEGGEEPALTAAIIELPASCTSVPWLRARADRSEKLLELHCELGQGFYFSKPLPFEGVEEQGSACPSRRRSWRPTRARSPSRARRARAPPFRISLGGSRPEVSAPVASHDEVALAE